MSAHELAVWVLCYGLGYSLLRHGNIGMALVGLLVVGWFTSQRHGDDGAVLIAYGLGVIACWLVKRGMLRLEGGFYRSRWRFSTVRSRWWWRSQAERTASEHQASGRPWTETDTETDHGFADDPRREDARKRRAEEARWRRQQEDARKGRRGPSGHDQQQEQHNTREQAEQTGRKRRQKQQEEPNEPSNQPKAPPESSLDLRTPEAVLGVRPGCSLDELKQAYRRQCQRLHPDRWQDRPPPLRAMLEEEQKRVNVAFQTLEKRLK